LFLICLARTVFFGVATFLYADTYDPGNMNPTVGGHTSPDNQRILVIFLVSPEYLVIFAYFILFWQLLSLYFDGHANLFHSVLSGKGKYFITAIGVILFVSQAILIVLYLQELFEAKVITIQLIVFNFAAPFFVAIIMLQVANKFSGSPLRAAVYSQKLRNLQIALLVWSLARIVRAVGGIYESTLFYGMVLGLEDRNHNTYLIPMMLIVMFLLIEIAPFLFVLDPSFMETFLLRPFPDSLVEPLGDFERPLSFASRYSQYHVLSTRAGSLRSQTIDGDEALTRKSDQQNSSAHAINEDSESSDGEVPVGVELLLQSENDFELAENFGGI